MKDNLQTYLSALLFALITLFSPLAAQVSGISYTLSPTANYNFWDDQAGLANGLLAGGYLGIGFGENVELRGMYLFDLGLKTNFDDFGFANGVGNLAERDVNLTRYGGEVRLNLGRSRLLPFLTLGAGIQELELDGGGKNEHIYASAGLGVTVSVADRLTFKLEGKNTAFNFNSARNLLTEEDRIGLGVEADDFLRERLSNWSVGAGLTVYLGGRRPGTLTELDRAYAETFTGGFSSISLLVEPTLARINFDDVLPYKDLYLGGAGIGLDFGPLVGFRAFYLKGMEDDNISFDFDDIAVYGADFRFSFSSAPTGLSPFVSLGGGYIDTQDEYRGNNNTAGAASQAFASGGLGASINLSRNFRLTGNYKVLLTTSVDAENIESTEQIATSNQWSVGLNLAFGKKARRPDAMFTSTADAQMQRAQAEATMEKQVALADQAKRNAEATRQLKNDYEVRIYSLNEELETAQGQRDSAAVDSLMAVIQKTEEVVAELDTREKDLEKTVSEVETETNFLREELDREVNAPPATFTAPAAAPQNGNFFQGRNADGSPAPPVSRLSFTPAEFEGLIEEIFEGLNYGMPAQGAPMPATYGIDYDLMAPGTASQDTARVYALEQEVRELSAALMELKQEQNDAIEDLRTQQEADGKARVTDKEELREEMNKSTQSILEEIRAMRTELGNKSNMTDKEREQLKKDAEKAAKKAKKAAEKAAGEAVKAEEKRKKEEAKRKKKAGGR